MSTLRKEKELTIDGHEYRIRQLGALEGRRLWLKLLRVLAGPLKELALAGKFDEVTLTTGIASVVENLDEATAEELYVAFGKNCELRVAGDQGERWPKLDGVVFDTHFAGRYLAMSQWLGECVVFNFAGFFDGTSLGKITALAQKAAAKSASPTTSTGTSTESSPTNAPP